MTVSRRRLFQSLAIVGVSSTATEGAEAAISLDALRNVSEFYGINLSDDRLRVVKPVLERRLTGVQALRDFEFGDSIAPTQGILEY